VSAPGWSDASQAYDAAAGAMEEHAAHCPACAGGGWCGGTADDLAEAEARAFDALRAGARAVAEVVRLLGAPTT
jgi:hypothetical protein